MFPRSRRRIKDGKPHEYFPLVETVRTQSGPRQRRLCYLGELNGSAQSRWLKTIEVFNEQGESRQLKLFPSEAAPPEDDEQVMGPAAELDHPLAKLLRPFLHRTAHLWELGEHPHTLPDNFDGALGLSPNQQTVNLSEPPRNSPRIG